MIKTRTLCLIIIAMNNIIIWNAIISHQREERHYNALSEALVQTCSETDDAIRTYCTATKKGK